MAPRAAAGAGLCSALRRGCRLRRAGGEGPGFGGVSPRLLVSPGRTPAPGAADWASRCGVRALKAPCGKVPWWDTGRQPSACSAGVPGDSRGSAASPDFQSPGKFSTSDEMVQIGKILSLCQTVKIENN